VSGIMKKRLFNTKIKVEKMEKKLSAENCWVSEYVFWKEVWASISIKDISSKRVLYLFVIKWREDFPNLFRIKINEKIFTPTQSAILDPSSDLVLFHAVVSQ
jgi:head-tail adaptor